MAGWETFAEHFQSASKGKWPFAGRLKSAGQDDFLTFAAGDDIKGLTDTVGIPVAPGFLQHGRGVCFPCFACGFFLRAPVFKMSIPLVRGENAFGNGVEIGIWCDQHVGNGGVGTLATGDLPARKENVSGGKISRC